MTDAQVEFSQAGLGTVLKQNQLHVPLNQREYAWEKEHVMELFQDFANALALGTTHFLGTIVTIPRGGNRLEVVDGQQRLATTALLLAASRDYLTGVHDVLVESISQEFLTGIDRDQGERVPRLRLNIDDNELFHQIVTGGSPTPTGRASHKRLMAAYKEAAAFVRQAVATFSPSERGEVLNRWVDFIEFHALVVVLKVPDAENAFRMFETLNDRGLHVSQADLVKNYLFSKAEAGDRITEAQTRWSSMRGLLESIEAGPDDITITFLRHALIAMTGHLRESDVYATVQSITKTPATALTFLGSLENAASVYVATFNPEHEKWNGYPTTTRRSFEVFNVFNIKPFRPLMFAVGSKMEAKEADKAFQWLISLGVRLMIASTTRSESVEKPLGTAAAAVYDGNIATAADLVKKLAPITPTDGDFREAMARARVSNNRLARYYLRSLEMTAKDEDRPWFIPESDPAYINLEHVLPRKPEGNWPQFNDDEAGSHTTRLGNLVLMKTQDNGELKSAPFAVKKPVYEDSAYVLTQQVGAVDDWTVETIEQRQATMADLALRTWPAKLK